MNMNLIKLFSPSQKLDFQIVSHIPEYIFWASFYNYSTFTLELKQPNSLLCDAQIVHLQLL